MEFSATQIAALLGGTIDGDPDTRVSSLSKIEEGKSGTLSFLANPKYTPFIYTTGASIVIVCDTFIPEKKISATLIKVPDAYSAFAKLLDYYNQIRNNITGVSPKASVSKDAVLGTDIYIGEFSVVSKGAVIGNNARVYPQVFIGENVEVGENTTLFPGVKIYTDCKVGKNCRVHSGAIIGGDGFGFAPQGDQNYMKVAQIGNVIIEDDVEIGSNTTIDRATLGSTIIRKGVKLDNLIQVAHNVEIGENTVIAAQTGISGSTRVGRNCMIGGQVGIIGHITIADEVKIAAQSGIGASILQKGETVQGSPAFEIGKYRRSYVHFRKLSDLNSRVEQLQKELEALKKNGV
ncbi:MAG: UDP-3-O-(3-hydroxymyristoyl)glucosamine N-acyltransferase [Bacteroidales bacterium]|nr:UDP-3-O-(3-hydroxymyristoyl)glucosamine N-acyltransferase [Bacteroidales bacterium]